MSYKGKKVIRMVGKIIGGERQAVILLEYEDHTQERITWELKR